MLHALQPSFPVRCWRLPAGHHHTVAALASGLYQTLSRLHVTAYVLSCRLEGDQVLRTQLVMDVDRPPDEVFAYVVDFTTLPEYDRWVESAQKTSQGKIGAGSTWTQRRVQGRRSFDAPIRLVEFEPPHRFVMLSDAEGFDVRSAMTFEPRDSGGTRIIEVLEMRLSGPVRLFQPIIRRQVHGRGCEIQQRLKEVLEAGHQTPQPSDPRLGGGGQSGPRDKE